MTRPERVQLRRARGWCKPAGAVVVARPTRWGNPHRGPDAAHRFADDLHGCIDNPHDRAYPAEIRSIAEAVHELAGRDLACWCPLDRACHADTLLQIANPQPETNPI